MKIIKVMDDWPKVPQFPISLYHDMSIDHLQALLQRTLQTLVKHVAISHDCMDALQQHIPHRSMAQQAGHSTAGDTILSQRQPQRYVGTNMAMPEAIRPESALVDALARDLPPLPLLHTILRTF